MTPRIAVAPPELLSLVRFTLFGITFELLMWHVNVTTLGEAAAIPNGEAVSALTGEVKLATAVAGPLTVKLCGLGLRPLEKTLINRF
jgi:hypothetical protein